MYKRKWDVLLVAGLVVAFPVLLLSLITNSAERPDKQVNTSSSLTATAHSTQPTELIHEDIMVKILMPDGEIVIEDLERYTCNVVLAEMPASFEMSALQAQAVVARTYVVRRMVTQQKHDAAYVCADPDCCQGYLTSASYLQSGGNEEAVNKITEAVNTTAGEVLVYGGRLIDATYFACSGGFTESAEDVWGEDIPYLQSTRSPGEEGAKYFVDTVFFGADEFESLLGVNIGGTPAEWFGEVTYTDGFGIATIRIGGQIYKGVELRKKLGLRSTAFTVTVVGELIAVMTRGFGHRVGMSQYGADAMAVGGADYRQILAHYYSGTNLVVITSAEDVAEFSNID